MLDPRRYEGLAALGIDRSAPLRAQLFGRRGRPGQPGGHGAVLAVLVELRAGRLATRWRRQEHAGSLDRIWVGGVGLKRATRESIDAACRQLHLRRTGARRFLFTRTGRGDRAARVFGLGLGFGRKGRAGGGGRRLERGAAARRAASAPPAARRSDGRRRLPHARCVATQQGTSSPKGPHARAHLLVGRRLAKKAAARATAPLRRGRRGTLPHYLRAHVGAIWRRSQRHRRSASAGSGMGRSLREALELG